MSIKKKKVIKLIVVIIFVILMLLLFVLWGGKTFSKHKKYVESSGVCEVAKPVFVVDGAENIKIDGVQDTVYNFCIKNYTDTEISQVSLDYYIEIVNDSKADLGFVLNKNGQAIGLDNNKSKMISLTGFTKQDDNYELQITHNNNTAITSDIEGNVQIKVEAVQVE